MATLRRFTDDGLARQSEGEIGDPRGESTVRCDQCGARIVGLPASRGLFLWTRGDEVRVEEPPLCEECASSIPFGLGGDEDVGEE